MKKIFIMALLVGALGVTQQRAEACTGIALKAADGSRIMARTVEWAASALDCGYVVVPRGHKFQSMTPTGENGLRYNTKYGFVGIYTANSAFVVEGMNERGLSAGLFFFPGYGEYENFDPADNDETLSDMQFVSWVLSQFSSIDQLKAAIEDVDVVALDSRAGTVHWRIAEPGGRCVVLEFEDGEPHFYENPLGVLTNSPGFEWQMTNLNNYVNLHSGAAQNQTITDGITLKPFGGGSAMLGLPGDFTPPSRFVRAAFMQTTSPMQKTGFDAVAQAFHILNNFDVPLGMQTGQGTTPEGLQSATQFTSVSDQTGLKLYYKTTWNNTIRCLDLKEINFEKVGYQTAPLDQARTQPIENIRIQ